MTEPMHLHLGRAFKGNAVERGCPCPLAPCGLADSATLDPACSQHGMGMTMRQMHAADDCPGAPDGA